MTVKQVVLSNSDISKTIIICIDEGVADPENGEHYRRGSSSIVRLQDSIRRDSVNQVSIYLSGRTTREKTEKTLSPIALAELSQEAHAVIAGYWRPGDKVILIGAGRGGSICLEVAKLLGRYGVPDRMTVWKNTDDRVCRVQYDQCVYKKDGESASQGSIEVEMLALFDPLSELIFPSEYAPTTSNSKVALIDSNDAPGNVKRILSLLAIDDHREFFVPLIFAESPIVTEVWVPGMHEAVIGIGRERLISDTSLSIVVKALEEHGVDFDVSALEDIQENKVGSGALGCEGTSTVMVRRDRKIESNQVSSESSDKSNLPLIHVSVVERMKRKSDYHPQSVLALDDKYLVYSA